MSIIGKKVFVYDERTGEGDTYTFPDRPLNRWMGGLIDACDTFGLSREEMMAIFEFSWRNTKREGSGISLRGLAPILKVGVDRLIRRGWMTRHGRRVQLVRNESTEAIFDAAWAAVHFGPAVEGDRPN